MSVNYPMDLAKSSRRGLTVLLIAAIVGLGGITGWRVWQLRSNQISQTQTDSAEIAEITTVTALGRLEPEGEVINLTASTSTQESRIEQLLVKEGDRVAAEQVIAILAHRAGKEASLQKAEEQVRVARAKLAQVEAGAKTGELQAQRAEIARLEAEKATKLAAQRAAIARLEAEVANARIEAERYELLYQQGAVSASQRDSKRLTYTTAQPRLEEAQAELARIQTTSQQQIQQAEATLAQIAEIRPVDIEAAQAEVQAAIATVAEAKANLEQVYVRSPRAGQIIKIHTHPGEKIAPEGIATLGETQQMIVIADVYQSDINKIKLGQPAKITSPVLSETLEGKVEQIGLQVEQQQVINEDPAANIDAKVVEVHIRLNPASSEKAAGLTNLQVTATIETK
ncbi:ABC exporter membrane fusion protein [Oscillatoria salina]|uniref:ABC exporter membrane fusion protein n=1 Tax=Oscillatoria salina TaxID=331517 RepID=UPI001CCA490F|nr:ABC exporter membrane fusion protein [Oscillatoria salina]